MTAVPDDLFSAAVAERLRAQAPLAARLRPRTIDDVVGQEHLVGPGRPLRRLVEQDRLSSVDLLGAAGHRQDDAGAGRRRHDRAGLRADVGGHRRRQGRARGASSAPGSGSASTAGARSCSSTRSTASRKAQQDALLPAVEDGTLTLIGATTENPFFEVNPPLRSRSTLFRLEPLDRDGDRDAGRVAGSRPSGTTATPEAIELLVDRAGGDGRQVLTSLEVAVRARAARARSTLEHVEAALGTSALRYGRDDHYDVISAFIKSMRGSDPDAAVYWLARMLEAGEDARFIARRMVIFASEDVGMADPQALLVAVAAAHAVEHVGLPEAQLNLAQAVIHLATAPKSNRAALAIWNAREAVSRRGGRRGAGAPARRALPGRRGRSATGPATSTLMTTTVVGSPSSTCPTS